MAYQVFNKTGIKGLAAAVPKNIINNYEYTEHFPKESVIEVVDKVGIKERRFTDNKTCSSDLCFAAAEKLLADMNIDKSEIDLLVFVSQTPDYRMPATAITLQHRLGLPNSTIAFDVNMGCSGFLYGMSITYSIIQQPGFRKALLLDGETRSKVYSPKDRMTAFLFGDAGVAAIIEKGEKYGKTYFSLNSDGSRSSLIQINAGGYRNPSSVETVTEKVVDEHGNIRSEEHGYMNGPDVFNFLIREVPKDISGIINYSGIPIETIDYFLFHQANLYMNSYLVKKLKLDTDKVPMSIEKFGNTSSVSIPLTIVTQLQHKLNGRKKMLFSGFGVGLSWASAITDLSDCHISDLVEI
ncbi:MAG: ketoacyl-ACP synthase III [Ignavibacteria bacterium]|nr:ketoacyl-ACP synthase III [Ignavibacteria bacterium]